MQHDWLDLRQWGPFCKTKFRHNHMLYRMRYRISAFLRFRTDELYRIAKIRRDNDCDDEQWSGDLYQGMNALQLFETKTLADDNNFELCAALRELDKCCGADSFADMRCIARRRYAWNLRAIMVLQLGAGSIRAFLDERRDELKMRLQALSDARSSRAKELVEALEESQPLWSIQQGETVFWDGLERRLQCAQDIVEFPPFTQLHCYGRVLFPRISDSCLASKLANFVLLEQAPQPLMTVTRLAASVWGRMASLGGDYCSDDYFFHDGCCQATQPIPEGFEDSENCFSSDGHEEDSDIHSETSTSSED